MTFANPLLHKSSRALPKTVAIIGAGTIGPDIGYYLKSAIPNLTLHLVDVAQAPLDRARQRFSTYARKAVERGKMSQTEAENITSNLHTTTDYTTISDADWVIEAATEDVGLKQRIFAQVEAVIRPDALITSNTSSLPASRIFAHLTHKERATVTHFFAPAWRNPIVEVIRWKGASPSLVDDLNWLFCMTGKVPLITDDVACFMLDRIFDNWCNDAALLLDQATAAEIDSVASEFVHAGPFFVLNMANGNPIIVETNTLQMHEEGAHYRPADIFRSVDSWRTVAPGKGVEVSPSVAATVRDRMLGVLMSQTVDILDRNIGAPADLELGCRLALGFKQGPLDIMRTLDFEEVTRIVKRMQHDRPGMPLPRNAPESYQKFRRHVLVDDVRGVKVLTIRRPDAMNALHDELTDELLAAIREHENDSATRGFVITGYGPRAFCAGADIGRFPRMLGDAESSVQYARDCSRLLVHLDRMNKPVIAALNGMALGGGLELALRCHAIVAVRNAWMQLPEITLGIVPGIGAMVVPYRRWPNAAATFTAMLRRAERLKATTAHDMGIIDTLADNVAQLIDAAIVCVDRISGNIARPADGRVALPAFEKADPVAASGQLLSAEVVGILERAISDAAAASTFSDALEIGYRAFGASACTKAAREGIDSFLQGRTPDFSKTG